MWGEGWRSTVDETLVIPKNLKSGPCRISTLISMIKLSEFLLMVKIFGRNVTIGEWYVKYSWNNMLPFKRNVLKVLQQHETPHMMSQ